MTPQQDMTTEARELVKRLRGLAQLKRGAPLHDNSDVEAAWVEEAIAFIERAAAQQVTPEMVSRAARVLCEVTCAAYPCRECSPGSGAFDLASRVLTAALAPPTAAREGEQK